MEPTDFNHHVHEALELTATNHDETLAEVIPIGTGYVGETEQDPAAYSNRSMAGIALGLTIGVLASSKWVPPATEFMAQLTNR